MNPVAVIAARLARPFEGLFLRPYLCPAGVPTIGYGSTFYEDGVRVTLQDPPITKERAEELLAHEMRKCVREAYRLCPMLYLWGESAAAAIADFAFNCGTGALSASTLRRKIAADMHDEARTELMKWVRGGGRVLPGLVKRRAAECALIG